MISIEVVVVAILIGIVLGLAAAPFSFWLIDVWKERKEAHDGEGKDSPNE